MEKIMPRSKQDGPKNPRHEKSRDKGRRTSKPVRVFQKEVTILITGQSRKACEKTASDVYKLQNEYTKGGKDNRRAQIIQHESSATKQIGYMKL